MQTMADFTNISDSLALMADPALQQFAQMHKDDPFSLSLAVSESNRRRKMRAAQQGGAGAQPQPSIADQEIAQMGALMGDQMGNQMGAGDQMGNQMGAPMEAPMMPEDVGIGALAAPNMQMPGGGITGVEAQAPQGMAGGGMVAFAGGGDVERYQDRGLTRPQFVQDIMGVPQAFDEYKQRLREEDALKAEADRRMAQAKADRLAAQQKTSFFNYLFGSPQKETEGLAELADLSAAQNISGMDRRLAAAPRSLDAVPVVPAALPGAGPTAPPGAPPGAGPGARPPAAPPRAPAAPAAPGIAGLDVATEYKKALEEAGKKPDPNAEEVAATGKEKVKVGQETVAGLEAIQKQFSDIFKGRKERLDTREAELGKMKDQGLGLALLQAGAAMMSTPGGLGAALGKGVQVGGTQYAASLDKVRSAQEKIADARDRLEETEAQRGELSARELLKARTEVKNISISAREDLIKSRMLATKENRETAMKQVDSMLKLAGTREEIAGRRDVAGITAAAYRDTAGARGDSGQNKAMATLLETTRKNIEAEALKKYPYDVTAQEKHKKDALKTAIQTNPALAQYMGVAGGGNAPSADLKFDEKTGQFVPMR